MSRKWRRRRLKWLLGIYPPFRGAGIRIDRISADMRVIEVRMPLRWYNRNYVGTHYGGSLYSMCDPFFMLILMEQLGPGYVVWDKRATIEFLRPGRGTVRARFEISEERVEEIRRAADEAGKVEPRFETEVVDEAGETVARVGKLLYVRRRSWQA